MPSWTLSVQQKGSGQGDKLDYNQFVQSLQAELREADTLSQVSVESVQLSLPEDAQAHGLMGASNNWQRYVWKPAMLAFCSGSVMLHQSCMLAAKKASKSIRHHVVVEQLQSFAEQHPVFSPPLSLMFWP